MEKPLLIDLVGTETNQIPDRIENICVIVQDDKQKMALIKDYVMANRDKKMMMFTETKKDAAMFEFENYATFMPIHGDLSQN
jgi:superfamily II DNA/RNA helicase